MENLSKRWLLAAATLAVAIAAAAVGGQAVAGGKDGTESAKGLGPTDRPAAARSPDPGERDPGRPEQGDGAAAAVQGQGRRPDRLVRPPRHLGCRDSRTTTAINYAPKLAQPRRSVARSASRTVTLESPTPADNPFGQAVVDFAGKPDFSPTRVAEPGPDGFPLEQLHSPARSPVPATARSSGSRARRRRVQRADRRHG